MIKFFYSKGSVSYAAHILLEELGIKYQAIQLNLKKNDQKKKKYLKLNPKGRVPLIITQYGSISETPAILYFISQMYPKKNLCPKNPYKFAQALSFNCYISSTIHVAYAHKIRGNRWVDDELSINKMKKKVTQNMRKYAKTLEKYYIKGPWVMGKKFSICDPYLAIVTKWLRDDNINLNNYKKIKNHDKLMKKRNSVKKVYKIHCE